jgi:hypothetical protein
MPQLTRRRSPDAPEECWHVFYGDVRVGTIAIRSGIPHDEDPWEWNCGFYPGSHPGEHRSGTAATFDEARAEFERAWRVKFLLTICRTRMLPCNVGAFPCRIWNKQFASAPITCGSLMGVAKEKRTTIGYVRNVKFWRRRSEISAP